MDPRDTVVVPPGHEVTVTPYSPFPCFTRARGGALLVDLGLGGTEQRREVEELFGTLWEILQTPLPSVHIPQSGGQLSNLFAPHRVSVAEQEGLVIWTAHVGALHGFLENVEGLQALLSLFYRIVQHHPRMRTHMLYLIDARYVGLGLLPLLRGLGIELRKPDPSGGVLMEVKRPEGVVLSSLMGAELTEEPGAHDAALVFNRRKDAAQKDPGALAEIEREERSFLARACGLGPVPPTEAPKAPLLRESRLRRLLLATYEAPTDARTREALAEALLAYQRHLLVPCDGRGAPMRMQWGQHAATLIYCDVISLRQFQMEHGILDRFPCMTLTLAEIAELLVGHSHTGVLGTYRRGREPRFTHLNLPVLRALQRGRPPTPAEWSAPMSAP